MFLDRPDVVALGEGRNFMHLTRYSTAELLRLEQRLITAAVARQDDQAGVVTLRLVDAAISDRPMADEQIAMVDQLCRGGSGVVVVAAAAGTGKTYALAAARQAWQSGGYQVIGTALAAKAARELEGSAGISSGTIAKLTDDLERRRVRFGPDTVIVVDEAGMAGTRQLAPILDAAETAGAKVVLVGDPHQLPEIEAGGMLNALTRLLDPITLAENRRQHELWEREALAELRTGDVDVALDTYQAHGRLVTGPHPIVVRQTMADDWWVARQDGDQVVMLAIRRSDVDDLNGRARQHLEAAGIVHGPALEIDERRYQAGDEIICLYNDYRLGVRNGDRATIEAIDSDHRTMRIRTGDGMRTLPAEYLDAGHVAHGYATTIHKAQGATVDHSLVLGTDDLYREAGYVALSRGRTTNTLYTVGAPEPDLDLTHAPQRDNRPSADLVRDALHRDASKDLAVESADPLDDWGIGRVERRRLVTELEALKDLPPPAVDDDFGLGL